MSDLSKISVVLPSLDPDEKLVAVIDGLLEYGFTDIILVNDGSKPENLHYFEDAAAQHPEIHLLHHPVNRGKGAALKTAFAWFLENRSDSVGVVTVDGDNQHHPADTRACCEHMMKTGHTVLGCRDFNQEDVPARSSFGNKTTSLIFKIFVGMTISDTQTGLRALPRKVLEELVDVYGDRFEYETNMLLNMKRMGIGFIEQPIETVYEDDNVRSHYNAVKDSLRIVKVMIKFMLSSLGSTLIDLGVFYLAMRFLAGFFGAFAELAATVIARASSSFVNFNTNNSLVFGNEGNYKRALLRYYCLCIPQMLVSAALVTLINNLLANTAPIIATAIKFVVDTTLFFISYQIQREWVFSNKK